MMDYKEDLKESLKNPEKSCKLENKSRAHRIRCIGIDRNEITGFCFQSHEIGLLSVTFVFLCETAQSQSQANNFPFPVGEKLSFRVSWSNTIDAGSADLTVGRANSTGNDLLRIQLKALTSPEFAQK
jgi:hypothetical protein